VNRHSWKGPLLARLGERDVPAIQQRQLEKVQRDLIGEAGKGRRWVVAGDFNMEEPSILGVWSRVQGQTCGRNCIDHFLTPMEYTYRIITSDASDHYPVVANIVID
jgi:endonuclease/exonuclease/phosphatase family metal-dependent hydrolase